MKTNEAKAVQTGTELRKHEGKCLYRAPRKLKGNPL